MASTSGQLDDLLARVKSEFLEMPGLRLTEPQARRLWGLDEAVCRTLLAALVDARFLFRTRDGAFMKIDGSGPRQALSAPSHRPSVNVA